jgi:TRAP transporter TAXI family solute receptor
MKKFLMTLIIIIAALLPFTAAGEADPRPDENLWPKHLRILTGPAGGQWFFIGEFMARIFSINIVPTISRTGGGLDNIAAINDRLGDVGFTLASFLEAGHRGQGQEPDTKIDNVAAVANVYPQVLYFIIRKDFADAHNITSVDDLLQKRMPLRFASLKPGTASEFILRMLLQEGYNTSFEQLKEQGWSIAFNNYAETADNLADGKLDCFAYTAGTEVPLILTLESHLDIAILPIKREVLDKLSAKLGTNIYTIKPGTYRSVTQEIDTLGDYSTIIVRRDLHASLVYAICQELWKQKTLIARRIKDYEQLDPASALSPRLQFHPGALQFWQEQLSER